MIHHSGNINSTITHLAAYQPDCAPIASLPSLVMHWFPVSMSHQQHDDAMDPSGSSSASSTSNKKSVCTCRKHCNAQLRLLLDTTFYRHLAEAEEDECNKMMLLKPLSLNAAHCAMASCNLEAEEDPPEEASPSTGMSQYTHQLEIQCALSKRACEMLLRPGQLRWTPESGVTLMEGRWLHHMWCTLVDSPVPDFA